MSGVLEPFLFGKCNITSFAFRGYNAQNPAASVGSRFLPTKGGINIPIELDESVEIPGTCFGGSAWTGPLDMCYPNGEFIQDETNPNLGTCKFPIVNSQASNIEVSSFVIDSLGCTPPMNVVDGKPLACTRKAYLGDIFVCSGQPLPLGYKTDQRLVGPRTTFDGNLYRTCPPNISNNVSEWDPSLIENVKFVCAGGETIGTQQQFPNAWRSDLCTNFCYQNPTVCASFMFPKCSTPTTVQGSRLKNMLYDPICQGYLDAYQGAANVNPALPVNQVNTLINDFCDTDTLRGNNGTLPQSTCERFCFASRNLYKDLDCDDLYFDACTDAKFQLNPACSCYLPANTYEDIFKSQFEPFEEYFKANPFEVIPKLQQCQYAPCSTQTLFRPKNVIECQSQQCFQVIDISAEDLTIDRSNLNLQNVCNNILNENVCNSDTDCKNGNVCGPNALCVGENSTCGANSDCPSGFNCVEGRCNNPTANKDQTQSTLLILVIVFSILAGVILFIVIAIVVYNSFIKPGALKKKIAF